MRGFRPFLLVLGCCLAASVAAADLKEQRAQFKLAWTAATHGDLKTLTPYLDSLKDYPLYPYLVYAYLKATVDTQPDAAVEAFLDQEATLPVSDDLRRAWLLALAKRQDWTHFLAYYGDEDDPALRCAAASAHVLNPDDPQRDTWTVAAQRLWLTPRMPEAPCAALFDYLQSHRLITGDMLRSRVENALQSRDYDTAQSLLPLLSADDRAWAKQWLALASDPWPALEQIQVPDQPAYLEMLLANIRLVARTDPDKARHAWSVLSQQYHFSHDDARDMRTLLALQDAWHLAPEARRELLRLTDAHDPRVTVWRERLAVRDRDWHAVLAGLPSLGHDQSSSEWQYWKARALEGLGRRNEAEALYGRLARVNDYYGFLAADRAHLAYNIRQQVSHPEPEVIDQLGERDGFVRSRELFYADLYAEADDEWNLAVQPLSAPARCQAALLAERWGWYARVIQSLSTGDCWQDQALTYPIAYEQTLVPQVQQLNMDLPWVYGLIRAESVFRPNAVSHVGARGLMQLMPATGLDLAARLGLDVSDAEDLMDPPTNLTLGSTYLHQMLAHFAGSEPVATAAYNAGATRVQSWLPDKATLPADAWIDSIPYDETRNYVHRVMGHTVMFDWRINGTPQPLSVRIGTVAAPAVTAAQPVAAVP